MTKERKIEILRMDGCTRSEAEKFLKYGTAIYDNFEEEFDFHMESWGCDEEEIKAYRSMIDEKTPVRDWSIVEHNGKTYYIAYAL